MFVSRCGRTSDFLTALSWHRAGHPVTIDGWVKLTHAGNEKVLKANYRKVLTFDEILPYYPKYNIVTEHRDAPVASASTSYVGWRRQNAIKREQVATLAENVLSKTLGKKTDLSLMKLPPAKLRKMHKLGKISRRQMKSPEQIMLSEEECQSKLSVIWNNFEALKSMWQANGHELNIIRAFHGTHFENTESIFTKGFTLPWRQGMLGRGIYVGPMSKAKNYGNGLILAVEVMLGNCKELDKVELIDNLPMYDSLHMGSGVRGGVYKGYLNNEEWVVRNPSQIRIVGIHVRSRF